MKKNTRLILSVIIALCLVSMMFVGCSSSDNNSVTGKVATPTFSPTAGNYSGDQTLTMSTTTAGATLYYTYTWDGTAPADPTRNSAQYTGAVTLPAPYTYNIKAMGVKSGYNDSEIASGTWNVAEPGKVAAPMFDPAPGTYSGQKSVTMTSNTPGATIYYTLDGTTPTTASTVYSSAVALPVPPSTTVVKALAVKQGMENSDVTSGQYSLQVATKANDPTISLPDGPNDGQVKVSITGIPDTQTAYYTLDGTNPVPSQVVAKAVPTGTFKYTVPFDLPQEDCTLKVQVFDNLGLLDPSDIASRTYTYQAQVVTFNMTAAGWDATNFKYDVMAVIQDGAQVPATDNGFYTPSETKTGTNFKYYYTAKDDGTVPADPVPGAVGTTEWDGAIIEIIKTTTFKVVAKDTAVANPLPNSPVKTFTITLQCQNPEIWYDGTNTGATVDVVENGTMQCRTITALGDVQVCYTTDGDEPINTDNPTNNMGATVAVDHANKGTWKFKNFDNAGVGLVLDPSDTVTKTINVKVQPLGIDCTEKQAVTNATADVSVIQVTSPTAATEVFYTKTTDGTVPADPTNNSTPFVVGTKVDQTSKYKFIAYKDGFTPSAVTAWDITAQCASGYVFVPPAGADETIGTPIAIANTSHAADNGAVIRTRQTTGNPNPGDPVAPALITDGDAYVAGVAPVITGVADDDYKLIARCFKANCTAGDASTVQTYTSID